MTAQFDRTFWKGRRAARDSDYSVHDLFVKPEIPLQEATVRALFEITPRFLSRGHSRGSISHSEELLGRLTGQWRKSLELGNLFGGLEDWEQRYRTLTQAAGPLLVDRLQRMDQPYCLLWPKKMSPNVIAALSPTHL